MMALYTIKPACLHIITLQNQENASKLDPGQTKDLQRVPQIINMHQGIRVPQ